MVNLEGHGFDRVTRWPGPVAASVGASAAHSLAVLTLAYVTCKLVLLVTWPALLHQACWVGMTCPPYQGTPRLHLTISHCPFTVTSSTCLTNFHSSLFKWDNPQSISLGSIWFKSGRASNCYTIKRACVFKKCALWNVSDNLNGWKPHWGVQQNGKVTPRELRPRERFCKINIIGRMSNCFFHGTSSTENLYESLRNNVETMMFDAGTICSC